MTAEPTALCRHCSTPVTENGRNWIHTTGLFRCPCPHDSWAEAAPSYAVVVESLSDAADSSDHWAEKFDAALTLILDL